MDFQIDTCSFGTVWEFSILAAEGTEDSPAPLVSEVTYGDEFDVLLAIQALFEELSFEKMRETWFGLPVLKAHAMSVCRRCSQIVYLQHWMSMKESDVIAVIVEGLEDL